MGNRFNRVVVGAFGTVALVAAAVGITAGPAAADAGHWGPPFPSASLSVGCGRGGFPTVNAAVQAATPGATVTVCPGTYDEDVVIPPTKSLSILGIGNPVIDALHLALQQPCRLKPELEQAFAENERVILLTTHRRENLGSPLQEIYLALRELIHSYPDLAVVFPVHKNPKVRQEVAQVLQGVERVYLTEPLDYLPFINVMKRAHLVLTDSGGIQEEAPALGKPVLVLRDVTERPEAVAFGTARLVGTDRHRLVEEVRLLLDSQDAYAAMATAVNPYGDGQAAQRIVQTVLSYFHLAPPPEEFRPVTKTSCSSGANSALEA